MKVCLLSVFQRVSQRVDIRCEKSALLPAELEQESIANLTRVPPAVADADLEGQQVENLPRWHHRGHLVSNETPSKKLCEVLGPGESLLEIFRLRFSL